MPAPSLTAGFDLPFQEQIDFFRAKINMPTEAWDDIWQAAHDRAFVVAGAMKADLLDDLRQAVDKAITTGTTLETFRNDFREIVGKHGWQGWTGEGTPGGFAWRTKVIYETNLRSSYEHKQFRVDIGLENALNKQYSLPLGGAYIGQGATMSLNGAGAPYGLPVPGMGRSLYAGVSVKF